MKVIKKLIFQMIFQKLEKINEEGIPIKVIKI